MTGIKGIRDVDAPGLNGATKPVATGSIDDYGFELLGLIPEVRPDL